MRNPRSRLALLASIVLALSPLTAWAEQHEKPETEAAPAAETERKAWNAEEMTSLTGDLAKQMREIRRAWRKDPAFRNPTGANRKASARLDQRVRELDQRTTQLANRVKGGGGYEETLNIARNIGVLLNDVDMHARRIMTSPWDDERVRLAMVLINEIAAFYGRDALFDPESMQRTDRPERTR